MPARSLTSAPAENSLPAAVRIATRTSSRALISSKTRISSSRAFWFGALTGGRSMGTVATWPAISRRTVSSFIRASGQNKGIHCDAALRQRDERIDLRTGDLRVRRRESRHRDQRVGKCIEIGRGAAARAGERRKALKAGDLVGGGRAFDRREPQGHVLENLDVNAAEPKHNDRPKHRIALGAADRFDAPLDHP